MSDVTFYCVINVSMSFDYGFKSLRWESNILGEVIVLPRSTTQVCIVILLRSALLLRVNSSQYCPTFLCSNNF